MARVELINVKKIYQGKVTAVHDFNLDIADKEFIVFVGPSGCGKSTTLRMVAGLEDISEGECKIDGVVVNDLLPKDRSISMVFQNYALYPHLTVFENMAFPLRLDKRIRYIAWSEEEIKRINEEIQTLETEAKANEAEVKKLEELKEGPYVKAQLEKEIANYKTQIEQIETQKVELNKKIEQLEEGKKSPEVKAKYEEYAAKYDAQIEKQKLELSNPKADQKLVKERIAELEEKRDTNPYEENLDSQILDTKYQIKLLDRKITKINNQIANPKATKKVDADIEKLNHAKKIASLKEKLEKGKPIKGYSQDEIFQKVTDAAKVLNITQYLTRKPKALSGGQRQRVAIGRAMVKDCKVFLMDEPLSNLDAKLRNQMRAEIILLRKRIQTTFIYVTHDQTEAMTLGDRIVCMRDGFIMQVGTPTELFDMPDNLFVAQFIGAPMMNTFNTELVRNGKNYSVDLFGVKIPVTGEKGEMLAAKNIETQPILLGVRPEHMSLDIKESKTGIPVTVEVCEMMGSEIHVHVVTKDDSKIIVRIPTINMSKEEKDAILPGNEVYLTFEPKAMHFFNPENELNLLAKEGAVNSKGPIILPSEMKEGK